MRRIPTLVAKALKDGEYYVACGPDAHAFSCNMFDDKSEYVHHVDGAVVLSDYGGKVLAEIGRFSIVCRWTPTESSLKAVAAQCIRKFAGTWSYYEELIGPTDPGEFVDSVKQALHCEDRHLPLGVLTISRLEIPPAYRGREFGLHALRALIQRFRMGVSVIAMTPFPLQFDGDERTHEQLRSGVRQVPEFRSGFHREAEGLLRSPRLRENPERRARATVAQRPPQGDNLIGVSSCCGETMRISSASEFTPMRRRTDDFCPAHKK